MVGEEDIPAPYINNSPVLRENVSSLLQSWGLSDLKPRFKTHQIEARALFCLTEKDICELIPKIGRRAIFRSSLMDWRRQNKRFSSSIRFRRRLDSKSEANIPIPGQLVKEEDFDDNSVEMNQGANIINHTVSEEIDSEEQDHAERPLSESIEGKNEVVASRTKSSSSCQIDVREILNNSYEGQQIIAYYEVNGNFDYSHRRRLVTLLITEVIRKNRWLVQDDFSKISHDLVLLFPREDESTYYTARNGLKNPKGCLYNKFLNLTRKLRQEGVLQYRNNVHMMPERTSARHYGETKCYRESS